MVSTEQPKYAHKGGTESAMQRLEARFDARIKAEVEDGLKSVDEAVTENKALRADLDALRDEHEAERKKLQVPGSSDGYNFGRVGQAAISGGSEEHYKRYAPHEWEVSETYAQSTSPDASGGFWIPGEVRDDLMIELVRPSSVVLALGAQQMAFTSTPVEIPREQGTVLTPTGKAENAALDAADAEAGQMVMNPRLAGLIVKGSRRFFNMGAAADPFIRRILAREMRIKMDTWALRGAGGVEPIGILNATGVNGVDFSDPVGGVDFELYEKLVVMQSQPHEVGGHEVLESAGWAMTPKAERALRMVKSEASSAAWGQVGRKILSDSKADRVLGDPFRSTALLLSTADPAEIIYGDFFQSVIGTWGGMQIESTEVGGASFEQHQRWLKVTQEMDVGLWHPSAFAICNANWDLTAF